MLVRRNIARVIPQLYYLTIAMLGPLIMAGKIIASHVVDLCPGVDLDEPLVKASQEAVGLAETFLVMLPPPKHQQWGESRQKQPDSDCQIESE